MEEWKDIAEYEGKYQISNLGMIKRLGNNFSRKEIMLKCSFNRDGYKKVCLSTHSIRKYYQVHRLVAKAFFDNKDYSLDINHINGIKDDNRLENLEWCTRRENIKHAVAMGYCANNFFIKNNPMKGKFGQDNINSKPVNQYTINGDFIKEWDNARNINRELGILYPNISMCCRGLQKTAGGFIWKYK